MKKFLPERERRRMLNLTSIPQSYKAIKLYIGDIKYNIYFKSVIQNKIKILKFITTVVCSVIDLWLANAALQWQLTRITFSADELEEQEEIQYGL